MRALVIVARRYNGHEFWTALKVMKDADIEFDVMSTTRRISDEVTRERNVIEHTLDDDLWKVRGRYDGVMVVSGNPEDTMNFWTDSRVQWNVLRAMKEESAIASICVGVPAIRDACEGKRITCFPLVKSKELLRAAGATITGIAVETDGKLCTAEHQMASQMWAENFVAVMDGRRPPNVLSVVDGFFKPKERRPIPEVEDLKRRQAGVQGPLQCPECTYHTTIKENRIMCPKCGTDLTEE